MSPFKLLYKLPTLEEKKCNLFLFCRVALCCVALACSLLPKDQPRAPEIAHNLNICLQQKKAIYTKILILAVDFPYFSWTFSLVKIEMPWTEKFYADAIFFFLL